MVKKKKKSVKEQVATRGIVYEKVSMKLCVDNSALLSQQGKTLLGWEEEGEEKWKDNFLFKDENGVKIRCSNNVKNRPLVKSNYQALTQEILRGRWHLNGEPIIIGKTRLILNGQHTLIALVLACQLYTEDPKKYPFWDSEPTIEKLVVFGIDEDDETVNTMDTCKPRSLADVIYRSQLFSGYKSGQLKKLSRILDYAVRFLWHRTGVQNAFGLRRTHSESLAFIDAHPKLLDCVRHIYEEDGKEKRLSTIMSPGYSAGLLYLMATNQSDPREYISSESPNESMLDLKTWSPACDFFVLLAGKADNLIAARLAISCIIDDDDDSLESRCAILIKAWLNYQQGTLITKEVLELEYVTDSDGNRKMVEQPCIGGIDLIHLNDEMEKATNNDPTQKEIKQRAKKERDKTVKKKKSVKEDVSIPQKKTAKKKKKKGKPSKLVGKARWVVQGKDEPWRGKVVEVIGNNTKLKILQGFKGAGNIMPARVSELYEEQPQ